MVLSKKRETAVVLTADLIDAPTKAVLALALLGIDRSIGFVNNPPTIVVLYPVGLVC